MVQIKQMEANLKYGRTFEQHSRNNNTLHSDLLYTCLNSKEKEKNYAPTLIAVRGLLSKQVRSNQAKSESNKRSFSQEASILFFILQSRHEIFKLAKTLW